MNKEPLATGYNILRSTDGTIYTQLNTDCVRQDACLRRYHGVIQTLRLRHGSGRAHQQAITPQPFQRPRASRLRFIAVSSGFGCARSQNRRRPNYPGRITIPTAAGLLCFAVGRGGKAFTQVANLNSSTAAGYSDTTALSGHSYSYEIQAYNGSNTSAASAVASVGTPLAAFRHALTVTADAAATV